MITNDEKNIIIKLPDVNGVGIGLNELITIYMVKSNKSTEKDISDMLKYKTYKIEVIGEIKMQ